MLVFGRTVIPETHKRFRLAIRTNTIHNIIKSQHYYLIKFVDINVSQ